MPRPGRSRAPRVLALACACAVLGCEGDDALPELALPPGDPGNLTGVWEGEQLLFGEPRLVRLFLHQDAEGAVAGRLELPGPERERLPYAEAPDCDLAPVLPQEGRYRWSIGG
ncbi:MAG TPA: hypothetical protein RMG45_13005, partial [Polyangiaceae bacterium LLY-WYZ-15_(1-7)]|nr:hypothetical protein [Polyangiaceae bacterium LLY-WYZ-15_(1-7)]